MTALNLEFLEIANKVCKVVSDQTGRHLSTFNLDTNLVADMGLDSMDCLELDMALEDAFDSTVELEQFAESKTTIYELSKGIYEQLHGTLEPTLKISMIEPSAENMPKTYKCLNKKRIWVTFKRSGFHCYPGAPVDVDYLQSRHRHLFGFKITIDVLHANREIEFHQFLNWIESLYDTKALELSNKSCEMMADDLYKHIEEKYGTDRFVQIEVSEDGECGCINTYESVEVN